MAPELTLQLLATSIALASAVAAFLSARASKQAAVETRLAARTSLVNAILDAYASPDMLQAMVLLRAWTRQHGIQSADEFRRLRRDNYNHVREVDQARRYVSHFFHKIYVLYKLGFLDEKGVRAVAVKEQVVFLREVIEPLEAAINTDYDRWGFDALGALYGISRPTLLPMAGP